MAEDKQPKTVTLSDGRTATIHKGKGKHAKKALMLADGKGDEYLSILMASLVEIDNNKVVPEDLDELDMSDYMAIQTAFAEVNF